MRKAATAHGRVHIAGFIYRPADALLDSDNLQCRRCGKGVSVGARPSAS